MRMKIGGLGVNNVDEWVINIEIIKVNLLVFY